MTVKKVLSDYLPTAAVAALILYFAITKEQSVIKTLPTLITLIVQILLVRANRFGFLLGAANSVLYGVSYFTEGLYFSVISAIAISAPIQVYSYFNWKKAAENQNPTIKFLTKKQLILALLLTLGIWGLCSFLLAPHFESASFPTVDSFLFASGLVVSFLAAWRFSESQYLNMIACTVSLVMWILLTVKSPANLNYVIISAYNLFRVTQAAINWTKIYLKNKKSASHG